MKHSFPKSHKDILQTGFLPISWGKVSLVMNRSSVRFRSLAPFFLPFFPHSPWDLLWYNPKNNLQNKILPSFLCLYRRFAWLAWRQSQFSLSVGCFRLRESTSSGCALLVDSDHWLHFFYPNGQKKHKTVRFCFIFCGAAVKCFMARSAASYAAGVLHKTPTIK